MSSQGRSWSIQPWRTSRTTTTLLFYRQRRAPSLYALPLSSSTPSVTRSILQYWIPSHSAPIESVSRENLNVAHVRFPDNEHNSPIRSHTLTEFTAPSIQHPGRLGKITFSHVVLSHSSCCSPLRSNELPRLDASNDTIAQTALLHRRQVQCRGTTTVKCVIEQPGPKQPGNQASTLSTAAPPTPLIINTRKIWPDRLPGPSHATRRILVQSAPG